jgi:hypothetical protein
MRPPPSAPLVGAAPSLPLRQKLSRPVPQHKSCPHILDVDSPLSGNAGKRVSSSQSRSAVARGRLTFQTIMGKHLPPAEVARGHGPPPRRSVSVGGGVPADVGARRSFCRALRGNYE